MAGFAAAAPARGMARRVALGAALGVALGVMLGAALAPTALRAQAALPPGAPADAPSGAPSAAPQGWVQIEAQPTLARAEERARAWATQFPDVAGFRLDSGWYAIALGPYPRDEAQRRLAVLKAAAAIPADSYLTEAGRLGPRFWPVGAGALGGAPGAGAAIETRVLPEAAPAAGAAGTAGIGAEAGIGTGIAAAPGAGTEVGTELAAGAGVGDGPAAGIGTEIAAAPEAGAGAGAGLAAGIEAGTRDGTEGVAGAAIDLAAALPPEPAPPASAAGPAPAARDAPAAATPAPPVETLAEARRGEALLDGEARRELQQALAFEGHYSAGIDGAFGPGTRAAMSAWQQAQGAEPTGVLTSAQRAALLAAYRGARDSLGLAMVEDAAAGIAARLPLGLLAPPVTRPPFVHYAPREGAEGVAGGVQVLLISQPGDAAGLAALFQQVQALQAVPLQGARGLDATRFTLDGMDAQHLAHAEARLASGQIKGFVLIWPRGDDRRQALALAALQESFRALPGAVLPDPAREGIVQAVDLVAGMERRRPDRARSGFYIDAGGHVLTSADAVAECRRVTLEGGIPARVLARDAALGLALLAPEEPLAPLAHARWRLAPLPPGSEVAVAGYAWEGRLGAAVVSFGRLVEAQGPDGSPDRHRLALQVTPGEAGAPVLDAGGAVAGLLLPQQDGARSLPDGVRLSLPAARIARFLADPALARELTPAHGGSPGDTAGSAAGGDMPLPRAALEAGARDMAVAVGCWN